MSSPGSAPPDDFAYVSFPDTPAVTQTTPARASSLPGSPAAPDSHARHPPKTLLGRFKSALGASVWPSSPSGLAPPPDPRPRPPSWLATPAPDHPPFHARPAASSSTPSGSPVLSGPINMSEPALYSAYPAVSRNRASSNPPLPPGLPAFSHIPGFPLARETMADDVGSLLSSSVAQSSWKGQPSTRDEGLQVMQANHHLLDRIQGEGLSRHYWMPDKAVKECYDCASTFTSWRRKHHCRICGAIFCARCASNLVSGQRFASAGYVRVCNMCLDKLEPLPAPHWPLICREDAEDENHPSTSDPSSPFHIFGTRSHPAHPLNFNPKPGSRPADHQAKYSGHSALSQSTRPSSLRSHNRAEPESGDATDLSDRYRDTEPIRPTSFLTQLHHPSSNTLTPGNRSARSTFPFPQSATYLTAPFRKGLDDQDHTTGLLELKIVEPSQRLFTPTASSLRASFISRPASSERLPWFEHSRGRRESKLSTQTLRLGSLQNQFGSSIERASLANGSPHELEDRSSQNAPPEGPLDTFQPGQPWVTPSNDQKSLPGGPTELHLSSSSLAHLRSMIRQSLHRDRVPNSSVWEFQLTQLLVKMASNPPRPNREEGGGEADIRQLIKIKKIPGGQPQDCEYVHGVVFTKNVVHKKMRVNSVNPRVLAVSFPLDFQRTEGHIYMKLEPLIRQEKQYLKSLVTRLTSLRPDVLLVEGDVPGLAIEYLVQAGVSVMRHVKPRVLKAVAQSTQAPVISSLDKLLNHKVGQCHIFCVQTLDHRLIPGRRKSFVRLEGCRPDLGGTILLRGGHLSLLSKIKNLMSLMVTIVYSLRLENHFLRDEGAIMTYDLEPLRKLQILNIDNTEIQTILKSFKRARRQLIESKLLGLPKPGSPQKSAAVHPQAAQVLSLSMSTRQINDILQPYECMLLSGSPNVKLAPPVVLTRLRDLHQQVIALRRSSNLTRNMVAPAQQTEEKLDLKTEGQALSNTAPAPSKPSTTLARSVDGGSQLSSAHVESPARIKASILSEALRLADLGRQLAQSKLAAAHYLSLHRSETFHPSDHQRIVVQEAVVCRNPATGSPSYTCQGPQLRLFSYYAPGDQSMGEMVALAVRSQGQVCPAKGCGQFKKLHQTDYIHGRLKATLRIHHLPQLENTATTPSSTTEFGPLNHTAGLARDGDGHGDITLEAGNQDLILTQSYCPYCDGYTRKIKLSDDASRLSFGKYLELCFYGIGIQAEYVIHASTGLRLPCKHDLHLGHTRIFFHRGLRIDFSLSRINVYEMVPPPMYLTPDSHAQWGVLEDEYRTILNRSEAFFRSVRQRINVFNYDVVVGEKHEASEEAMRELTRKVEVDAQMIQVQLDEVHLACVGTNGVKINTVRKTLVDKAVEWDHLFATFELKFIATDHKDARRLTSVQLRKVFTDQSVTPGSPDKLLSRLHQLPSFNSNAHIKGHDTSQSEVESDHAAQKYASSNYARKTFHSPTMKTVASALAFALPTSMPVLVPSLPDVKVHGATGFQSKTVFTLEGESSSTNDSPEKPAITTEQEEEAIGKFTMGQSSGKGQLEDGKASLEAPQVDFNTSLSDDAFKARATISLDLAPLEQTISALQIPQNQGMQSFDTALTTPASLIHVLSSSAGSATQASQEATPKGRLTVTVQLPCHDCDDGCKSDTTVIDARDHETSTLDPEVTANPLVGPCRSDTDDNAANHSEADESREDDRKFTIRGKRVVDIGQSKKGGVAKLVDKFEKPTSRETRLKYANSVISSPLANNKEFVSTEQSQSSMSLSKPAHRLVKTPTNIARPIFRRGKSEIVRSISHVPRGKRSAGPNGSSKSPDDGRNSPKSNILVKNNSVDQNSVNHGPLTSRLAARHQLRVSNKPVALKMGPEDDGRRTKIQSTSTRLDLLSESTLRSSPRFITKDSISHRTRPESGLAVSSFLNKRNPHHQPFNNGSKVTIITRHFDRISREAERERQKHRLDHRSRPRPIAHAKSSVHAFSSLTAAVHEDTDSDLDECNVNPAGHDADDEGDVTPEAYGPETPEPSATNPPRALPPLQANFTEQDDIVRPILASTTSMEEVDQVAGYPDLGPLNRLDQLSAPQTTPCSPSFLADSFRLPPSGISQFSDNEMSSGEAGRNSIIKTLSSLWSYRSAEFSPLEYPQLPTEHQSAENPVLIREDEPSSIIAYTFGSKLYQDTLKDTEPRVIERSEIFMPDEDANRHGPDGDSTWGMIDFAPQDVDMDDALKVPPNSTKPMQFRYDVAPCTVTCKVFFMHQFEALRKTLGCKDIVESLARCHKWDASGGKSGQNFLKTKDGRYLIKGISKTELEALTKFAPAYFEYLSLASREKRPITLAKMFGIFQISFINKTTNRKGRLQVQVIENLWRSTKSDLQIYDLKGLTRNRTVNVTGRPNEVLLDGNFCGMTRTNPIFVHEDSLLRLQASLHNDTLFLASNNVMDYSLAIGIDEENQQLHVGIIDYLRTYSWDKRLETLVKELGGSSKEAPTIITPSLYKARFRRAMARYFIVSPDAWLRWWKPYLLQSDDEIEGINKSSNHNNNNNEIGVSKVFDDNYIHL